MPPKRKLAAKPSSSTTTPGKKLKQTTLLSATSASIPTPPDTSPLGSISPSAAPPATTTNSSEAPTTTPEDYDKFIINRKFYPPLISNASCAAYQSGEKPTPFAKLSQALSSTAGFRTRVAPGQAGVHWFRTDLRIDDNTGLSLAGKYAEFVRQNEAGKEDFALIGLFVISPEDLEAHVMSPARMDFAMRSLEMVKADLEERNIPLVVVTVEKREEVVGRVLEMCEEWGAKHLWANAEYEVDELRRDEKLIREGEKKGIAVNVVHDTCVVPPGTLTAKSSGNPYSVYTPWYKSWLAYLRANPDLLDIQPPPPSNPSSILTVHAPLFSTPLPQNPLPPTPSELETLHTLYPAGSHAAHTRLTSFLSTTGSKYHTTRNTPSIPGTSLLSPHFTSGTLSTRTAVSSAYALDKSALSIKSSSTPPNGFSTWISELAWRDFYRHILAAFPWVCMNKPFKPEFTSIAWCPSPPLTNQRFEAWKAGKTGYPLVDAAMRHLAKEKFMPNRLRMVVASFLCKDLHVDWRRGEQYFMGQLVDADFASNNGGWGWSSSAGADPQPYFRVFNPESQLKTFDPEGVYVRRWVEELRDVEGAELVKGLTEGRRRKLGYPQMIVDHDVQRKKAVEMYKVGIEKGKSVVD